MRANSTRKYSANLLWGLLIFSGLLISSVQATVTPQAPLVMMNWADLNSSKTALQNEDASVTPTVTALIKAANKLLDAPYFSVTQNKEVPESGDNRDYFSVGPYWWPDPTKADGLPWIRKDGNVNPTFRTASADNKLFQRLVNATHILALAYYFTDDARYAKKAEFFMHHWFIDETTGMKPNLNYAQSIPGRTAGRGVGIIEFRNYVHVLDAFSIIKPNSSPTFQKAFEQWGLRFLNWLVTSKNGIDEAKAKNNHGTFYDSLVMGTAIHLGADNLALQIAEINRKRIKQQIQKNGAQKHELKRTRPFSYTAFNLLAFTRVAFMANKIGVDLWQETSAKIPRIFKALEFTMRNLDDTSLWPGKQEDSIQYYRLIASALRLETAFQGDEIKQGLLRQYIQELTERTERAKENLSTCALLMNSQFNAPFATKKFKICLY